MRLKSHSKKKVSPINQEKDKEIPMDLKQTFNTTQREENEYRFLYWE